jgi:hypothetical protein
MLKFLKKKNKNHSKIYLGDEVNIFYRFKGVFFLFTGFCTLNKKNTICLYAKKKFHFVFFTIIRKNINVINKLHTYFFDNLKFKLKNKTKNK